MIKKYKIWRSFSKKRAKPVFQPGREKDCQREKTGPLCGCFLFQSPPPTAPGPPWPKGVSGNPAGRPKGARNKFTEAVREGLRRAEEKLAQPGG